jgi:hypothetical protein
MGDSGRQEPEQPQKPQTIYEQQKERGLQKLLARIAKAEKTRESEKRKLLIGGGLWTIQNRFCN